MRMVDGETEHNNFDIPLLLSLGVSILVPSYPFYVILSNAGIAFQATADSVTRRTGYGCRMSESIISVSFEQQAWQKWVFRESYIRYDATHNPPISPKLHKSIFLPSNLFPRRHSVTTVAHILNILVDASTACRCTGVENFALVPLPSGKLLWEAASEESWRGEYETLPKAREIYGLSIEGQLIRIVQGMGGGVTATTTPWEEWYAGEDGFGTLVMLVASLQS